jgi:predicted transcriptional regulator
MRKLQRVRRGSMIDAAEASRLGKLRSAIAGEIDEMRARARILLAEARAVRIVCAALKSAREKQGLSLGDVERLTGIDRSALSKLERGERPNVTFETLGKYAAALGKRLVIDLADASGT